MMILKRLQPVFAILLNACFIRAQVVNLTVSSEEPYCPGESRTLTCSASGIAISWTVSNTTNNFVTLQGFNTLFMDTPPIQRSFQNGDIIISLNQTIPVFISTLRVQNITDVSVVCSGTVVSSNLTLSSVVPPSPPLSPRVSSVMNQPSVSLVSLQWDPPSDSGGAAVSYELTVSPTPLSGPVSDGVNTTQQITVAYSTPYNISIRAVNCAGASDYVPFAMTIAICPSAISPADRVESLNVPPVTAEGSVLTFNCNGQTVTSNCSTSGSWAPDPEIFNCPVICESPGSPSRGSVDVGGQSPPYTAGTTISYQCDNGLFPMGVRTSECIVNESSRGEWREDPGQLICFAQCTVPDPPSNGSIVHYESLNSTVAEGTMLTYQCDSGLVLTGTTGTIECGNDGRWSQDPLSIACIVGNLGSISAEAMIAITAVVSSLLSFIAGCLVTLLIVYLFTHKKSSPGEGQVNTAVYDEINAKIDLKSNQAYGHIDVARSNIVY